MAYLQRVVLFIALLSVLFSILPNAIRADDLCASIIIPQFGVPCNSYTVETTDGFVLGLYNIPRPTRIPVLLMHGYTAAGDNWVLNNRLESLATVLFDAQCDVWIGNNRNVQWSQGSSKYSSTDPGYWDWTWDELAQYDITALIQSVFNRRNQTKLYYVGHSQGTLTFFAALTNNMAQTTTVTSQLRGAMLLAPFAYNANINDTAPLNKYFVEFYADAIPAILGGPMDEKREVQLLCGSNVNQAGCANLLMGETGPSCCVNQSRIPYYTMYFPQVTSTKNFNHFGQTYRSGKFQKYNRNSTINLQIYGQPAPPLYNFTLFPSSLPLQLHTGGVDALANPKDVQHTLDDLPSTNRQVINYENYGHLDFIIGTQAYNDVYPKMITFMNSH